MPIPKVSEVIPRWKLFSREIESDLSIYHRRDIGEWFTGEMSSRKLLVLTDGLPDESWFKMSVRAFLKKTEEDEKKQERKSVSSLIFAQLHGQEMTKNA